MANKLPSIQPKYFYSLDVMRGVASLSIVFWHWQHFYYRLSIPPINFNRTTQPLYSIFYLFYNQGLTAVDFFFCLSGFIFFYLYSNKIAERKVDFKKFGILRFSRLYPLHLFTLIAVAVLQYCVFKTFHDYFVIVQNSFPHFLLNIFFIQTWGFESSGSFNGPSWSVSVEIFVYIIFFIFCWSKFNKSKKMYLLTIILGLAAQAIFNPIGRGVCLFFLGGVLYNLYLIILRSQKFYVIRNIVTVAIILTWIFIFAESKFSFFESTWTVLWNKYVFIHFHKNAADMFSTFSVYFTRFLVFPVSILCLALNEDRLSNITNKVYFVGQISYSSYLIHFPLQILFFLVANYAAASATFFYQPLSLLIFFAVLIILSLLSHKFLEMPLQKAIRRLT